jgi:hypothetical protein
MRIPSDETLLMLSIALVGLLAGFGRWVAGVRKHEDPGR